MAEIINNQTHTAVSSRGNFRDYSHKGVEPDTNIDPEAPILQTVVNAQNANQGVPLPICEVCGEFTHKDVYFAEPMNTTRRMGIACRCRREKDRRYEEREKRLALQRRLDKFRAYSLMDANFENSTFANWEMRDDNNKLYHLAKEYCNNWESVVKNNRGMLLHGVAGCGKSYASFAIANELYNKGVSALAISVSGILDIIRDSFDNHGEMGEQDVFRTLGEASLLILDDLGVEYRTPWSYERLYKIIDTRSRVKKPIIITTNINAGDNSTDLIDNLSIEDSRPRTINRSNRIYSRIVGMCAQIEVTGASWRIQKGEKNLEGLLHDLGMV